MAQGIPFLWTSITRPFPSSLKKKATPDMLFVYDIQWHLHKQCTHEEGGEKNARKSIPRRRLSSLINSYSFSNCRYYFRLKKLFAKKKEEKKKSRYLKDLRGSKKKNMRRGENGGKRGGGKNKYMLSRGWKKRRKYWNWQLGVNVCAREKEVIFENSQILSRWERNTPTIIYIYYHTNMAYRSLLVNYFFVLLK